MPNVMDAANVLRHGSGLPLGRCHDLTGLQPGFKPLGRRSKPPMPKPRHRETIRFYSVHDAYGEFSNFAPFPITLKRRRWPTSEHYFQSQKFLDLGHQEEIRRAKTPMIAARLGRERSRPLRRDWEAVKDTVMRDAVEAKFRQHTELRALLLATGTAELVEHTDADDYWGDGGDGSGRNMLGRILMEVRETLRGE